MLAMNYSFRLPADYDMGKIRQRISDKGHLLDGFPDLAFKAYLWAEQDAEGASQDNLYAPFYLWQRAEGMNDFLTSSGFAGLVRDFGWPVVRVWSVWHSHQSPQIHQAKWASREILPIPAHSDLAGLRPREGEAAATSPSLASLVAFDPGSWTLVRFSLWEQKPPAASPQTQIFQVGYTATPMA